MDRIIYILLILIITMFGMGSISTIVVGIPEYDSLDLLEGRLTSQGDCSKGRGTSYIPIIVNSNGSTHSLLLPCTTDLNLLKNKIDLSIEIRSRQISPHLIDPPEMEVWSVKADGAEVYSYEERVKRHNNTRWFNIVFLIACAAMWIFLFRNIFQKKTKSSSEQP